MPTDHNNDSSIIGLGQLSRSHLPPNSWKTLWDAAVAGFSEQVITIATIAWISWKPCPAH